MRPTTVTAKADEPLTKMKHSLIVRALLSSTYRIVSHWPESECLGTGTLKVESNLS
jgi:hypothetical protein